MKVKLESFLQEVSEKTTENNQYQVLTSSKVGLYLQSDYFNKQVASKDNKGYKIIKKGQFTYRAMSDTGEFFPNMLECTDIGIVSPAYPVFEIVKPVIIPEYLKYYFKSNGFQQSISSFAQGSTRTSIKYGKLKTVSMDLPNLEEQKRVIAILDTIHNIIDSSKQELKMFDDLIKARFVEMFGDPVTSLKGRKQVPFSEFMTDIKYGTSQPPQFSEDGEYKFIRATNIKKGRITEENMLRISEAEAAKIQKCKLLGNEIIIVRSGANTGDTCVVTTEYAENYAGYDIIITLDLTKANPVYFNELINTHYMEQIVKPLTARSAQPHLNTKQVQGMPMIVASMDEQNEFAVFVEQVDKSKVAVQKALGETQTLFDSLMQEYFG